MDNQIKIGFDLDGVIIDKPPLISKGLLEWLVRSHQNKKLAYRYPLLPERLVRWLSHHPLLRPAIKENLEFIKKIAKNKKYKLYLISGRYSFLAGRTQQWLKKHQIYNLFEGIFINLKNEQPHLFKTQKIKSLRIDIFIDDDLPLVKHLKKEVKKTKIIHIQKFSKELKRTLCDY
ncbi:hypothetical protein ISS86_00465 [Candidatus Microgenomates bacterium]|nr:hypothetical protein [Candidatus Microgenomates bacterium]